MASASGSYKAGGGSWGAEMLSASSKHHDNMRGEPLQGSWFAVFGKLRKINVGKVRDKQ